MSVDSGVSGPVEGVASPRSGATRSAPLRPRRGTAAADALADAVSTPSFRSGRGKPRRRGRRVTRIVRRIELWSVLKIALVFNTIMLGVVLGSVALLWGLANTTGLVDDLEGFLRDAGFEDFRFQGERMFEQVAFIGAVGALAATVFMVLATALLNLISEITGGIRFVVIEEIVETPGAPTQPPAPLALPTVPAAPPVAPPAPVAPPSSDTEAFAPPAAPSTPPSGADADDDEPAVSTAKAALAKSKTTGGSGPTSGARKGRRPSSTRSSSSSSTSSRSTARPKPKPAGGTAKDREATTAADPAGEGDDTSS